MRIIRNFSMSWSDIPPYEIDLYFRLPLLYFAKCTSMTNFNPLWAPSLSPAPHSSSSSLYHYPFCSLSCLHHKNSLSLLPFAKVIPRLVLPVYLIGVGPDFPPLSSLWLASPFSGWMLFFPLSLYFDGYKVIWKMYNSIFENQSLTCNNGAVLG